MSSGSQEERAEILGALARELRQFNGLGATFFRVAAARIGMTVTDMQVIDSLAATGPTTAGQLADLTGLTTGAITGMLNRLEEAGLVRRERDPADGRRVIVQLVSGKDALREINALFDSMGKAWDELVSGYDDEQLAFLLAFLKRSNALSREEIVQLQATPAGAGDIFSSPLGALASGQLVVSNAPRLTIRTDDGMADLYQAHFEGRVPEVKTKEEAVTIRYPRRLLGLGGKQLAAEVLLNIAIPWRIVIQGAASEIIAKLGRLNLAELRIQGGMNMLHLELPVPAGVIPVRISGGASEITVRRPQGVAVRVHLKGWVAALVFDGQMHSNVGNDVWLQSAGYETTEQRYEIDVIGAASMATITAG